MSHHKDKESNLQGTDKYQFVYHVLDSTLVETVSHSLKMNTLLLALWENGMCEGVITRDDYTAAWIEPPVQG